jgi:DNA repair protein RecN (Recombination protein N)
VTGETGAGKTMVVSGLGLLFGGRADPARVRPGAERASVEGRLRVDPDGAVARQVSEAGGDLDDEGSALVISRSVSAEGRSRAMQAAGRCRCRCSPTSPTTWSPCTARQISSSCSGPAGSGEALDRFAGPEHAAVLAGYQRAYQRHASITGRAGRADAQMPASGRGGRGPAPGPGGDRRGSSPWPGEDIELLAEEERLATPTRCTRGNHGARGPAGRPVRRQLRRRGRGHAARPRPAGAGGGGSARPALAALAARLSEAAYLLSDVAAELASYAQSVEADPARLAAVQERRAELARLVRAYGSEGGYRAEGGYGPEGGRGSGGDLAAVLGWAKAAAARLGELDGDDDRITRLAEQETGAGRGRRRAGRPSSPPAGRKPPSGSPRTSRPS